MFVVTAHTLQGGLNIYVRGLNSPLSFMYTFDKNILRSIMKRIRLFHIFTSLLFVIAVVVALLQKKNLLLSIIDSLFIIGITYVGLGALLYIFQKGFFNGIVYAFKRFRNSTKQGKYISQFDDLDEMKEAHEEFGVQRSYSVTTSFLTIGALTLVLSIVLTYLLYT
ncbi:hypothetical protein CN378_14000 [Bacillus sp. AFS015802]|nr:hypothetical protein CN378_14000 [Bacillus sp. AFS015802]